jgi:outer membrane protein assembly factor BamB
MTNGSTPGNWPTYLYNPERTGANFFEHTIAPSNVSELQELWSIPSNGSDFSTPIVVNGTLYFGSWNGYEYAVNATSGAIEWSTFLGLDTRCGVFTPMGISSTPSYQNGTLYLGGGNNSWYALNSTSGTIEWSYVAPWETTAFYNWASALVYRNSLYIGLSSCLDNPLVPAGLLELNISGSQPMLAHVFNTTFPGHGGGSDGDSIWSSPALDPETNTIWVTTGNENGSTDPYYPIYANAVIALNATTLAVIGSWQVQNVAGLDSDFGTTPTLFTTPSGLPMVVASDKNGYAYAFNRSNVSTDGSWAPAWSLYTGGGWGGGAFDGQTLYLGGNGLLYAVKPVNGSVLWSTALSGGEVLGAIAWANGVVYADAGSDVYAVDAANGTILWDYAMPDGESTVTEPVVIDGRLYTTSGDYGAHGNLTAFGLEPSITFKETGLPLGTVWSVTLNGTTVNSTNLDVTFSEPNGTYSYSATPPIGFSGSPATGSIVLEYSNTEVTVAMGPAEEGGDAISELYSVYNGREDLRAAFPSVATNNTTFSELVSWAGRVVTGQLTDSDYSTLAPFGSWYALMETYNRRPDLQAAFPDAYTNFAHYTGLVSWADDVVMGRWTDPANSTLAPFGYYYDLMTVYDGRPDLQSAYPNAFTNWTEEQALVAWAGAVVNRTISDQSQGTLQPYGYWYVLFGWEYAQRADLRETYPLAVTDRVSHQGLLGWAKAVVLGEFPDPAYAALSPFAASYEAMGS